MSTDLRFDDALAARLPLPLAQLYRRAHNAVGAVEAHANAYYLWEAGLKLLGATAVVEYARGDDHDPILKERLQSLARPSLGHWWEYVRRLTPVLADRGDAAFVKIRDLLFGRSRDDLPRCAGLDALLEDSTDAPATRARARVRLSELLDHLVRYRNREIGHGAVNQRSTDYYRRRSAALLAAAGELFTRLDLLAGRRLVFVDDVRRQFDGRWLVERFDLVGESKRRLESLLLPAEDANRLPLPGRLYLQTADDAAVSLHPLVLFDGDLGGCFFLNGRRGKSQAEYLCYTTGATVERASLAGEHRTLLADVLGTAVDDAALVDWRAKSAAEDADGGDAESEFQGQRTLCEFELLGRIGQGGMGAVYRAWQPSLGRQVALKAMLRAGDPKAEARFGREIRALGRVEHPNLVKVFSSGSVGDQWFFAMELIDGADLSAVCDQLSRGGVKSPKPADWRRAVDSACEEFRAREKPLSDDGPTPRRPAANGEPAADPKRPVAGAGHVGRVVEIVRQAAAAAHALHQAGVLHRDVKPGNIMLTPDGGRAVLMDLGLASIADEAEGRLTRTRQFVGTLRYASPEQVLGVPLDARAEVYSLGATLWELLTMQPLFGATEQTPTPDLMLKIQSTDPQSPRTLNPAVP
ncbi:MAG: protein kinase domain-containing protein, partial [Planctomycetia bacterium]